MRREHFIVSVKLCEKTSYLIWYTNSEDGVVVDESRRILVFPSVEALRVFASSGELDPSKEEPAHYDLDSIREWIKAPTAETLNITDALDVWNLLTDLCASTGDRFEPPSSKHLYEKLCIANGVPGLPSGGDRPEQEWSPEDLQLLAIVLSQGIKVFSNRRQHQQS